MFDNATVNRMVAEARAGAVLVTQRHQHRTAPQQSPSAAASATAYSPGHVGGGTDLGQQARQAGVDLHPGA